MKMFILILFFHVGPLASTDSNSSTTVPGFATEAECKEAGEKAKHLVDGTTKRAVYVCVEQSKQQ